jgi:ABC-type nitrate/sulfonate/bicarbonate transport system substrate-binding protein
MTLARLLVVIALVACGAPFPAAAPATSTPAPVPVTFMAGFKPQANLPFVAVYVAQQRGYFQQQGLDVTLQHSAGQGEHVQLLATNRVQFSTGSAPDVLKRVAQSEVPLVAIALVGQRGEQAFAVRADSGIATPKDWEGKLVGYKGTPSADYLAILRAAGVDREKVREVAVGFDPRVLVDRRVDVYPVFKSNEPHLLARLGVPVRLFEAADYGVPTLGLSLMTNREMAETRPDVVRRFLSAALRGLADAVADQPAAIDAVMKYAVGEDPDHQRFMLEAEIEDALTDATRANGLGWTTREQWERQQRALLEVGAIPKAVDLDRVVTDRFLKEVYREGKLVWP